MKCDEILTPSFINSIKKCSKLGHISGILLWIDYLSIHRMQQYTILQAKYHHKARLNSMIDSLIVALHSIENSMENIAQFITDLDNLIEALLDLVDCIDEENNPNCQDCCRTLLIWQQLFLSQQDIAVNRERVFYGLIKEVEGICEVLIADSKGSSVFGWERQRSSSFNSTISTSSTLTKARIEEG